MTKLKVLSLFAGIGGFDLGLERTGGFETVAFCEIEPHAQAILRKHWPEVPIYDDVRTLTGAHLAADGITVDVIVGGFPCQDISSAGAGAGIEGERSGLWADYARLIGELRPRFVIVENVSALLGRGLGRVLGDLAALRYDAVWHCIPASYVGAPHRRDRIWIVAYPESAGRSARGVRGRPAPRQKVFNNEPSYRSSTAPNVDGLGDGGWWSVEPAVGRVADGVSGRVDRLKQLGNAVVPQIPELIGRAILAAEGSHHG